MSQAVNVLLDGASRALESATDAAKSGNIPAAQAFLAIAQQYRELADANYKMRAGA